MLYDIRFIVIYADLQWPLSIQQNPSARGRTRTVRYHCICDHIGTHHAILMTPAQTHTHTDRKSNSVSDFHQLWMFLSKTHHGWCKKTHVLFGMTCSSHSQQLSESSWNSYWSQPAYASFFRVSGAWHETRDGTSRAPKALRFGVFVHRASFGWVGPFHSKQFLRNM